MTAPLLFLGLSIVTTLAAEPAAPTPPAAAARIGKAALPAHLSAPAGRPITDDELLAKRQLASAEPIKALPPKAGDFSLRSMSTLLAFNDQAVLLPKGCVLWCPDALQPRMAPRATGVLRRWAEFLTANRNWLATCEVTTKQARGEEPIPEKTLAALKARNVVVVATLNGLPVTVLPPNPASR